MNEWIVFLTHSVQCGPMLNLTLTVARVARHAPREQLISESEVGGGTNTMFDTDVLT